MKLTSSTASIGKVPSPEPPVVLTSVAVALSTRNVRAPGTAAVGAEISISQEAIVVIRRLRHDPGSSRGEGQNAGRIRVHRQFHYVVGIENRLQLRIGGVNWRALIRHKNLLHGGRNLHGGSYVRNPA